MGSREELEKFWVFDLVKYVRPMFIAYADAAHKIRNQIKDVSPILKKKKMSGDEDTVDSNVKSLFAVIKGEYENDELNQEIKKEIIKTINEEIKTFVIEHGGPNPAFVLAYKKFRSHFLEELDVNEDILFQMEINNKRQQMLKKSQNYIIERDENLKDIANEIKLSEGHEAGDDNNKAMIEKKKKENEEKRKKLLEEKRIETAWLKRTGHLKSQDFWTKKEENKKQKKSKAKTPAYHKHIAPKIKHDDSKYIHIQAPQETKSEQINEKDVEKGKIVIFIIGLAVLLAILIYMISRLFA